MIVMLILAAPVFAGGWAVVSLDALPSDMQAGESVSLGFVVRQHGDKPVDVHTWNGGAMPFLIAADQNTGQTARFTARKEGELGHYVVDVTFPHAGTWAVEIVPEPFAGTEVGTFTVQPVASATSTSTSTVSAWVVQPAILRVIGGALMLAALALFFIHKRGKTAQRVPALGNR
jgi:hypothetical protein